MTARKRLLALLTSATLTGAVLAASPAHAVVTDPPVDYAVAGLGTFTLQSYDGGDTYTITDWNVTGACPQTLTIPSAFENDNYLSPTSGEYAVIDSFTGTAFKQAPCLSNGARVSSATGNTDYVQIPESVLANGATPVIPANAFQNDDLVKGFDFLGAASTVPSVGTGAFTCNLAACVGTPWVKSAYHDEANSTNWTDGNTWNSDMVVRTLPTFSIAGGPAVALDRKHAKLVTALTSNSSGSITVVATAKIKVGRTWRLRTVCTKTVAITAGATLPTICTAGATARASIRLQKVKFRLSYTFTQTNTERVVLAASSVTVKRAR